MENCSLCGYEENIEEHHLSYDEDRTMMVCKKCHEDIHHTNKYPELKPIDYPNKYKSKYKQVAVNIDKEKWNKFVIQSREQRVSSSSRIDKFIDKELDKK